MANELFKSSWNPFDAFEMDLFGNLQNRRGFMKTDISDNDDKYVVSVELPGLEKKDIGIDFKNDTLTVSTVKHEIADHGHGDMIQSERSSESMARSFRFMGIDESNIKARYDNGVLKVELPKLDKPEIENSHKIEIE
ncbi:Hsp20/alpha crystallin family protein [Weissella muntiaci]|jgi:HSP20 family protein|uniref:Hsp20/alpha crystallin family protein n=1 Tax=Weissella muntiaci TaxID=2508881 RepID=A0A6C2C1T4_9LACO|nr:Hsp20/alpha crystallin family protein [Weissella muntiaci]TYC47762.1 Hsp20/alpha crystallin family protein [Weissella muntiaci]